MMRECSNQTGLNIKIYGPETHITAVVPLALGLEDPEDFPEFDDEAHLSKPLASTKSAPGMPQKKLPSFHRQIADHEADHNVENFTAMTRCVVYGLMPVAVQGMLDFDFICKRENPSVAAMIFPFSSNHYMKFYWGTDEILLPVYQSMEEAFRKHPEVSVVVNFASFRSVYDSVMEMLEKHSSQIKTIAIIAEGVPESQTRKFNKVAMGKGVGIIGPATVGGIKVRWNPIPATKLCVETNSHIQSLRCFLSSLDAFESEIQEGCSTTLLCASCTGLVLLPTCRVREVYRTS
jgi:ATP citrate (pro-S)-lyase